MGTYTTNYALFKPAGSDFVDVTADLNDNWNIVDTEIKNRQNNIDAVNNLYLDRFKYRKSGTLSVGTGTETDVTWETEVEDPNGLVAPTLTTFTVPSGKAGIWACNAELAWAQATAASDVRIVIILVNGNQVAHGCAPNSTGANNENSNSYASWTGYLAVGDTVKIQGFQQGVANLNIQNATSGTRNTEWSMIRLGKNG